MKYQGNPNQRWGHISYAQHGDDFFLVNLFELLGVDKPSYLDIGAHHPQHLSNTALLYSRGSRGVNVEANPNLIEEFYRQRPDDQTINIGVATESGAMPFFMYYPDGGRNTFCKDEVAKALKEEPQHPIRETKMIEVTTLNSIVEFYCGGVFPDLLTLDVEGFDFGILRNADFSRSFPKVVCVEVRKDQSEQFKHLLALRGYTCLIRLAENLIFIRNELAPLVR